MLVDMDKWEVNVKIKDHEVNYKVQGYIRRGNLIGRYLEDSQGEVMIKYLRRKGIALPKVFISSNR